jgi:hypothetical protein
MVEQEVPQQVQAPPEKAIARATGIALVVAVILYTAVLPAEHGIDPLKATGSEPEPKASIGARPTAAPAGFFDSAKMYAGEKPDELTIQDAH